LKLGGGKRDLIINYIQKEEKGERGEGGIGRGFDPSTDCGQLKNAIVKVDH
jgi:hypothetical protein